MKTEYKKPVSLISEFRTVDIITTSAEPTDDNFEGFNPPGSN